MSVLDRSVFVAVSVVGYASAGGLAYVLGGSGMVAAFMAGAALEYVRSH